MMRNENEINEQTVNALCDQTFFAGFGAITRPQIKEALGKAIKSGSTEFQMVHDESINKDSVRGLLNFKQSQKDLDKWFINSFTLLVKKAGKEETLQQRFPVYYGNKYRLKEGYNMLDGRAVQKKFVQVDKDNPKNTRSYEAWAYLDFKTIDEHGNFQINKEFNYNLEQKLAEYKIMGIEYTQAKNQLMDSLRNGDIVPATVKTSRGDEKMHIEAAPGFDSLKFYDEKMKPIRVNINELNQNQAQGQKESQGNKQSTKKSAAKKQANQTVGKGNKQVANRKTNAQENAPNSSLRM